MRTITNFFKYFFLLTLVMFAAGSTDSQAQMLTESKPAITNVTIALHVRGQDENGAIRPTTNVLNAQYPKILPDLRVIFMIKAPVAKSIQIQLGKRYDLLKDSSGTWSVVTDSQVPGFHYYSLLIDGVSVAGLNNWMNKTVKSIPRRNRSVSHYDQAWQMKTLLNN